MRHAPERRTWWQRLFCRHVESGASDAPGGERLNESRLVDDPSAGDVHKMGRGPHLAEGLGIDQALGLLGERAGKRDKIDAVTPEQAIAEIRQPLAVYKRGRRTVVRHPPELVRPL